MCGGSYNRTRGDRMALFHAHFHSNALQLACGADVILPEARRDPGRPLATLWLLHGQSDDHSIWQRRTSIERYAAAYRLAVVMPCVHRSFYADMDQGLKYWTFVSEELPLRMRQFFPLSARRQDNFVAGLSMGGYGAFKLALSQPERFAAAASLSGAMDADRLYRDPNRGAEMKWIFGRGPKGTADDLFCAARKLARSRQPRPRLFQWCGTEDFLHADNLRFRDHARKLGLKVDYSEGPGGHSWDMWDAQIQNVLRWLKLEKGGA
jgi:S-formylglutathione hydrolase FrmB